MMAAGGHAVTTFAGNTVNLAGSVKDASLCVVNPWCWGNIADDARTAIDAAQAIAQDPRMQRRAWRAEPQIGSGTSGPS